MKATKYLLTALFLITSVFTAQASNDKPVSFAQLPEACKTFIRKHFNENNISYAKMERDFLQRSYDVFFTNGDKVEFDRNGKWESVECRKAAVPTEIVPAKIAEYVASKFPNSYIIKIDRDRREYEVDLNNNLEIRFDLKFNVIGYDD